MTGWRYATRGSSYDGNDRGVWMSALPRVAGLTWERIAREFDDRGPEVCCTEITLDLQENSPELLDMAARCARDVGDPVRIMRGFCMSYRLLTAEAFADSSAAPARHPSDRKPSQEAAIDAIGSKELTREAVAALVGNNPELLLMAHNFSEDQAD